MKKTDAEYLDLDIFQGDEGELKCRTATIRKANKEHPCFFGLGDAGDQHTIKPGQKYRHEQALVDGDFWGQWRCCIPCVDKHIDEFFGGDEE